MDGSLSGPLVSAGSHVVQCSYFPLKFGFPKIEEKTTHKTMKKKTKTKTNPEFILTVNVHFYHVAQ